MFFRSSQVVLQKDFADLFCFFQKPLSDSFVISSQILKPAEKKKPNSSRPVTPPRNMVTKQAKK